MSALRLALLLPALLTLAVIGAVLLPFSSAQAMAPSDSQNRSISLQAGINLIAWGGTNLYSLADALPPAVSAVFAWDREQQHFDSWWREGPARGNTLSSIRQDQSLYVVSTHAVDLHTVDGDWQQREPVQAGFNLLGWTGPEILIADAFPDLETYQLHLWNRETQRFTSYTAGLPAALQGTRTTIRRGEAYWIAAGPGTTVRDTSPPGTTFVDITPSANRTISSQAGYRESAAATLALGITPAGEEQRALLRFDIAGNVPQGSTIEAVYPLLPITAVSGPGCLEWHRLTASWDEGAGVRSPAAGPDEGAASPAPAPRDGVTWAQRHSRSDSLWQTPGGDFADPSESTQCLSETGTETAPGSPLSRQTVQYLLDDPTGNFGWILVPSDDDVPWSAQLGSRESEEARPVLRVLFSPPPPLVVQVESHLLPRTLVLHEGINLVTWTDPHSFHARSDLYEFPPEITAAFVWDHKHQKFDSWWRDGPESGNDLWNLRPHEAAYLVSESPFAIRRSAKDAAWQLEDSVDGPLDLVEWTGPDTPIADALAGLDGYQVHLFDSAAQRFATYTPGRPSYRQGPRTMLKRGDPFWITGADGAVIQIASPAGWLRRDIPASADATIFSESERSGSRDPSLSFGITAEGHERRVLLKFDLAGRIPADAILKSAEIRLDPTLEGRGCCCWTVHQITRSWGQPSPRPEAQAVSLADLVSPRGDVTWSERFFGRGQRWTNPGGDFSATAADLACSTVVARADPEFLPPLRAHFNETESNFGWILIPSPNFTDPWMANFDSRENEDTPGPVLRVRYTLRADSGASE